MDKKIDAKNKLFFYQNHFHDYDNVGSKLIIGTEASCVNPLISVVMPIYNHPDFFRKSLLSVINQKCEFDYEIIIVDNDHPDYQQRNQRIVEDLKCNKIRYYINAENIGGVGSENRGVQLAKGKYISFCHDDDMLCENALQSLINSIKENGNEKAAIFGNYIPMDENDGLLQQRSEWDSIFLKNKSYYRVSLYDFLLQNYTNGCGALYDRTCYIEIGGFCTDYVPCPDYAFNIMYTIKYGAFAIKTLTMKYRVTTQSDTSKVYADVIKADYRLKVLLIETKLKYKQLLKKIVDINVKCEEYHQLRRWASKKTSTISYFLYRALNRIFISLLTISRCFR